MKNILSEKRNVCEINSIKILEQFSKITTSKFIRDVNKCFQHNVSYVMARYYARDMKVDIENIYSGMDNDRIIFEKFSSVKMPHDIEKICDEILNMPMKLDKSQQYVRFLKTAEKKLEFMDDLKLYVDLFFMVLEQKIERSIYLDFFQQFSTSEIFGQYLKNLNVINATRRWLNTLLLFSTSEPITK